MLVIALSLFSIAEQLHYNGCVQAATGRFQGAVGLADVARKAATGACSHTLF